MTEHSNVSLLRTCYEAFNSRAFDRALNVVDDNVEWLNVPFQTTLKGKEGYRQFLQGWVDAFPDGKVEIKKISAGDDIVVSEGIFSGTHRGIFRTPDGDIQPTNRKQQMQFCEVAYIRNGKLIRGSAYFDSMTMLKQLGIAPLRVAA